MPALTLGFSAFTPTYENIANRLSRLQHGRSASNGTQIRPNSAQKVELNPLYIQTRQNSPNQPRKRLSPSVINALEQNFSSKGDQCAGRLAKNTGIKKYNQRQLKEIEQGKTSVHLKTQGNLERGCHLYSIGNFTPLKEEKVQTRRFDGVRNGKKQSYNLIPGKIYKKDSLVTLMA